MKTFFGLVVIASAIGCATETLPETSATTQAATICDDPENCLRSNGGGVYTQELGNAGIGPNNFMITHFINYNPGVAVRGRYWVDATTGYTQGTAEIALAHLDAAVGVLPAGDYFSIDSVSETLTNPTFVLSGDNGSGPVTGYDLLHLQIVLKLPGGMFTVSFAAPEIDQPPNQRTTSGSDTLITLQQFNMRWNVGETVDPVNALSYCTLAPVGTNPPGDDPVVFQQGIIVNALTAEMNRDNNYVTLSCRNGAIAMARWWGYVYRGTQTQADMFETAMHMKRASYCGDETFYTRRNTDILIQDNPTRIDPNRTNDDPGITPLDFEATWGRSPFTGKLRALCVNMQNRRRKYAVYPPPAWDTAGTEFNGHCLDGTQIPITLDSCPITPPNTNVAWWFVDQKDTSP